MELILNTASSASVCRCLEGNQVLYPSLGDAALVSPGRQGGMSSLFRMDHRRYSIAVLVMGRSSIPFGLLKSTMMLMAICGGSEAWSVIA